MEQIERQVDVSLVRLAASQSKKMPVERFFLLGPQPGHVETQFRMDAKNLVELAARQHAQRHRSERFHTVAERFRHRALQPDQVARKQIVDDLPPAVSQLLEAKRYAPEQGVEMRDRQSVVWGKSGSVSLDLGGGRCNKKK